MFDTRYLKSSLLHDRILHPIFSSEQLIGELKMEDVTGCPTPWLDDSGSPEANHLLESLQEVLLNWPTRCLVDLDGFW